MAKIISMHSFRGGTGKSNITANLAYLLVSAGKRVAIIDGDIASPGIHIIYGLNNQQINYTLNDYLCKKCSIKEAAIDVSSNVVPSHKESALFIIPASLRITEIVKILREGYNVDFLIEGIYKIIEELELDYLLFDTHPGVKEETLLLISISDTLLVVMRPDSQDYQGTAVAIKLAEKLEIPQKYIIVNKCLELMDPSSVKNKVEEAYKTPVVAVLPYSEEMVLLGSSDLFVKKYPDHEITNLLKQVIQQIK